MHPSASYENVSLDGIAREDGLPLLRFTEYQMSDSSSFGAKNKIPGIYYRDRNYCRCLKSRGEKKTLCWGISTLALPLKLNGTSSRIYLQSLWERHVTARSIPGLKLQTFSYRARKQYERSKRFMQLAGHRQYWLFGFRWHVCIWRQNLNTAINY